jgi:competence protein ComEC
MSKNNRLTARHIIFAVVLFLLSVFELPRFFDSGLTFYAFDVGQGDAFLFHFPDGSNMLVDAGPRDSANRLVARLKNIGVRKIDVFVATHPHEDHIGGAGAVIKAFPMGQFWDSGFNYGSPLQRNVLKAVSDKKIRFTRMKSGVSASIGGASVDVIAPVKEIKGTQSDANNNSVVLLIRFGGVSFLMTGDMEAEEHAAVGRLPRASVLKAAHHGSSNGTDARLLEEVSPDVVILSYGRGNSYGHPDRETEELFRRRGIRSFATADGEVKINTNGKDLKIFQ